MGTHLIHVIWTRKYLLFGLGLVLLVALGLLPAAARPAEQVATAPPAQGLAQSREVVPDCALLDNPQKQVIMSNGLWLKLMIKCGRLTPEQLARRAQRLGAASGTAHQPNGLPLGIDVPVSDPTQDPGQQTTQSETSVAMNGNIVCVAYNDSGGYPPSLSGFAVSTDGGATFTDRGAIPVSGDSTYGDPSLVYRALDNTFYYISISDLGLSVWKSTDGCNTFQYVGPAVSGLEDKEMATVDNNPSSPYYGRMYVATDDFSRNRVGVHYSTDGGLTWSAGVSVYNNLCCVPGPWPAVAPNGDVYVSWSILNAIPETQVSMAIALSTDGGASFTRKTDIVDNAAPAGHIQPPGACDAPFRVYNGNIRLIEFTQTAVGPDGTVHVVYVHGNGSDQGDIFYSRSTDQGTTWSPEVRLNDDATTTDQFQPTISINSAGFIAVGWYDRRLDPGANMLFDHYATTSGDGGITWTPNVRLTDVSSPVPPISPVNFDPIIRPCYMGDYDQTASDPGKALFVWSDSRRTQNGHPDPDVWSDSVGTEPDFTLLVNPTSQAVCAPATTNYTVTVGSVLNFNSPVTLSALNVPSGTTVNFTPNPVTPPGTSDMGVNVGGGTAPGNYGIGVNGQTVTRTHTITVTLNVSTAVPDVPILTNPPDGATNVSLKPTFQWQAAAQATSYHLQVDDDPNFGSPEIDVDVTGTSYTATTNLASDTTYYWRVKANNACGQSNYSTVFSFTTQHGTGQCPPPDPFGYRCEDLVTRDWITPTTDTGITNDDQVRSIPIGFTFNFYGNNYTQVRVSSNGNLQFTTNNTAYLNNPLPDATMGYMIAPHWDDLYPPSCPPPCVFYGVTGSPPNRVLTIEWVNVPHFGPSPSGATFEVQLEETTGDIYVLYQDTDFGDPTLNNGASATVGIQNGTIASQYSYNQAVLFNGLNIRWTLQAATPTPTSTPTETPTETPLPPTETPTATATPTGFSLYLPIILK